MLCRQPPHTDDVIYINENTPSSCPNLTTEPDGEGVQVWTAADCDTTELLCVDSLYSRLSPDAPVFLRGNHNHYTIITVINHMSPRKPAPGGRQIGALCVLAGVILLAGCSGIAEDTPDLPDGDEAAERFSSVGIYNATVVTKSTAGNRTTERTLERTVRPATGEQYQLVQEDSTRRVTVYNGTTRWVYRPAAGEVDREQGVVVPDRAEQLRELVGSLPTDDETKSPVVPISPLVAPDSPSKGGPSNRTAFTFDSVRIQYQGVETVSGRETYVIKAESTGTARKQTQQTTYYDTETFVIMRQDIVQTGRGKRIERQHRVTNITFDPGVNESIFEFDPPDNATIVTTDDKQITQVQQYGTAAKLERAASGHVPDPSVPARFEFDRGSLKEQTVSIQYIDRPETLTVSRSTAGQIGDDLEQIDHRGRTYSVDERNEATKVKWRCGDSVYYVEGSLGRDTVLDIADSVECPAD